MVLLSTEHFSDDGTNASTADQYYPEGVAVASKQGVSMAFLEQFGVNAGRLPRTTESGFDKSCFQ